MNDIKIGCGVSGMYKIQVLEKGRVVEDRPWAKNMILNQGLDYALSTRTMSIAYLFRYHCVGTGTTSVSATDTGLYNEIKRTSSLVAGVGNIGRTISGNVATFRYTWDHSVEGAGGANYSEHGLSPSATAGNNLFARSLISGGTVSVAEGQQLRVIYDISVAVTPSIQTSATVGGTGWPVSPATNCDGDCILLVYGGSVGALDSSGGVSGSASLLSMADATVTMEAVSSIVLPSSWGTDATYTPISGSEIAYTVSSYTNGSFVRSWVPSAYAGAASWDSTSIIGWRLRAAYVGGMIAFKYDQNQTKANTHRLRYPSITVTWARA